MFEYFERKTLLDIQQKHSGEINIIIDNSIAGRTELIHAIYDQTDSHYVDDSWDGLYDALGNLEWLSNQAVRLIHLGLPDLSARDQKIYIDILKAVDDEWNEGCRMTCTYPINVTVQICFLKELKAEVEAILSQEKK